MSLTTYPKQRISYSERVKDDYQHVKDTIDSIIHSSSDTPLSAQPSEDYKRMKASYELYNNVVTQEELQKEFNPAGIDIGQRIDDIKPYNKAYNKIQVLLGEESKRPFTAKALLINSEGIKSKLSTKDELIREYVDAQYNAELTRVQNQFKGQEGLPEEELQAKIQEIMDQVMDPGEIEKYMNTTYLEAREILANKILNYLMHEQSIRDKMNDSFKHALLSGMQFGWTGIINDKPTVQVLNPLGAIYDKSPDTKFIEDGQYAGYRTRMLPSDLFDRVGTYLTDKDLKTLEDRFYFNKSNKGRSYKTMQYNHTDDFKEYYTDTESPRDGQYGRSQSTLASTLTYHTEYKTQRKVGFLEGPNEFGDIETTIVSEDFRIPEYAETYMETGTFGKKIKHYTFDGMDLIWEWIPEVWTGMRIDTDIYCCMGAKPYQYRSLDDPYMVKLGYHGALYSNTNAAAISLMDRMKPFQYLYFIVVHKLKQLIGRDRGQVFSIDASMIPQNMGLEKAMYYLENLGYDVYNPLQNAEQPGAAQRGKVTSSVSLSNMQHVMNYVQLMDALDAQISDVAGITRQREGQTGAHEAVSNTQSSIISSSNITEIYFQTHFRVWENMLNSLINQSKQVMKGKNTLKQYILDDQSIATLNITPDDLTDMEVGIFVANSAKENKVFSSLESLSGFLLNSDKASLSDMIKIFKGSSVQELERDIIQSERNRDAQLQQQQQVQQQINQENIEAAKAAAEDQQAHEVQLKQMELNNKIQLAEIDSFKFQKDQDLNNDGVPDQLQLEKARLDYDIKTKELDLKKKELAQNKELKEKEIKASKQKAASK